VITHPQSSIHTAIDACRQTRDEAENLLRSINEEGDTYFDRSDVGADVDVTKDHIVFLETVIQRMELTITALENCPT
jgi:hypothetical protein